MPCSPLRGIDLRRLLVLRFVSSIVGSFATAFVGRVTFGVWCVMNQGGSDVLRTLSYFPLIFAVSIVHPVVTDVRHVVACYWHAGYVSHRSGFAASTVKQIVALVGPVSLHSCVSEVVQDVRCLG